ncbi:MAG: hypothetical protein ACI9G1_001408 [Pirellulaceae bacterium]
MAIYRSAESSSNYKRPTRPSFLIFLFLLARICLKQGLRVEAQNMSQAKIGTTVGHWFVRGVLVGCLLVGASNAVSYFFRSDGFGNLFDKPGGAREVIGFPWVVWEAGKTYDGYFVDYVTLGLNCVFGIGLGVVLGLILMSQAAWLNRLVDHVESEFPLEGSKLQFSLRGLFGATILASICAAVAANFGSNPLVLGAIYCFGPLALILFAFIPQRISWQQRVAILAPAAITLIVVAVAVGVSLGMEFDRVLIGIFICWTPQGAFAALALTVGLLVIHCRQLNNSSAI